MYDRLLTIYLNLKEIPLFLRLFTFVFGIGGPLFILGAILPIGKYSIDGTKVTFQQFWASGAALHMLITGVLVSTISYGIYKRKKWAKHIFIALFVASYIVALVSEPKEINLNIILPIIICLSIPTWYLYFKKSVVEYFSENAANKLINRTENTSALN
jgi:hypothetical protein